MEEETVVKEKTDDEVTQALGRAVRNYFLEHAGFEMEEMILIVKGPDGIEGTASTVCIHAQIKVLERRLEELREEVAREDTCNHSTTH